MMNGKFEKVSTVAPRTFEVTDELHTQDTGGPKTSKVTVETNIPASEFPGRISTQDTDLKPGQISNRHVYADAQARDRSVHKFEAQRQADISRDGGLLPGAGRPRSR